MLAAAALLFGQAAPTPAQSHRLEWVRQEDGSYSTDFDDGQMQIHADCITASTVSCIVVRATGRDHIAVRRFKGDRLPRHSIGLMGNPAGYGCDLIVPTRTIMEQIDSGQDGTPSRARKFTQAGRKSWTAQDVQVLGGDYFPCVTTAERFWLQRLNFVKSEQ